ncbi:MAG TPA: SgcJ/EcaC family oxidoreductase [Nakamurella sp.]|nr:SgcJ/EcaC family oxidoreductase [Nakamurella sp.]
MDDETAIRTLIQDRTTAMRTGDAETICSSYAPDAVVFSLAPPLVQPPNGTRDIAQLQAWFAEKGGSVWAEVRDLRVTVDGDLALCTSLDSMGAPPDSPQPFTLWYRSTLGLRRTDRQWRIVHEHTSTPFHMDGSLRAATDLQP